MNEPRNVNEAIALCALAIENEGPAPGKHREIMKRHAEEWPTFWNAFRALRNVWQRTNRENMDALSPESGLSGAQRIMVERRRQEEVEGWTVRHDDAHKDGSLAIVAALYAAWPMRFYRVRTNPSHDLFDFIDPWPQSWNRAMYDRRWDHGSNPTVDQRIDLLTKAGALCAAEIDRLLREKAKAE